MSSVPSRWMTIGEFLLRRLEEAGVGHLFGVPGDFNLELLQQMEDASHLTKPRRRSSVGVAWPVMAGQTTHGAARAAAGRGAAWMIGCLWSEYGGLQLARVLRGLQRVPSRTCHLSTDQNDCRRSG